MAEGWSYFLDFKDRKIELEEGERTVGRSRGCDISIDDPSISRRHATVRADAGRIHVRDLASSNGTYLNGMRIQDSGELHHGDMLGLGDAEIAVTVLVKSAFETMRMTAQPVEQHGEATLFLQKASAELAQEALGHDLRAPSSTHMAPPKLAPLVAPAAPHMAPAAPHMAPPALPSPAIEPPDEEEPTSPFAPAAEPEPSRTERSNG